MERARSIWLQGGEDRCLLAWISFRLAQALWQTSANKSRAKNLIQEIRKNMGVCEPGDSEWIVDFNQWIEKIGETSTGSEQKRDKQ